MKDLIQIWAVVAIYVAMMVVIGVRSARKTKTLTDFVVGSRKAGPWMTAFAYGATYFSAVIFIGYAGRSGYDFGLWAILIGISNALIGTCLAWVLLGKRTRDVTRRLKIKTMPQMFKARYMSKGMMTFAAIVIFIFMIPYSASVYSGLSYLCEKVLNVPYIAAMAVIAIIAAVYLVLGGYLASLQADLVQGIIMIGGVVAMVFFVVRSNEVGGLQRGIAAVTEAMNSAGIGKLDSTMIFNLIGLCLLTSVGSWGMPQMISKFYGIASDKGIKAGTIISTGFAAIVSIGAYFVGSLSRLFVSGDGKPVYDHLVPDILSATLPSLLLGIVLVLVLAASVSTLSGLTLTSCSAVSIDLIAENNKNMDKIKTLLLTRGLCLLFILASFVLATFKTPILMLMSFSWGSISGSFLAPYLLGLWWKKMNRVGAWSGMITGLSLSVILAVCSGFNAGMASLFGVIAIVASFIACIIGSFIGAKLGGKSSAVPAEFFDKDFTLQDESATA